MQAAPNFVQGLKYPNESGQGLEAIDSEALLPEVGTFKGGFNDLLPYVVPAPDQENAGSCLFMSHTAVVEWWLSKIQSPNKINLSERYTLNLKSRKIGSKSISNWRTDTIYRFNASGVHVLNSDFPFTKGWFKKSAGKRVISHKGAEDAVYGTAYNWIVSPTPKGTPLVSLPKFERTVLYKDRDRNQWNTGQAPKNAVALIKKALRENKAPVIAIYNHYGYWHANMIMGYNDHANSYGCPFLSSYQEKMEKRAVKMDKKQSEAKEESDALYYAKKAKKYRRHGKAIDSTFKKSGGCKNRGVFYVRDSIYPDKSMPIYDYDKTRDGEESHLNAPVIIREYEWIERLSNHAVQITLAP